MEEEIKSFIQKALIEEGLKSVFVTAKLKKAIVNYKIMKNNPPKRVEISNNLSFILENKKNNNRD